MSPTPSIRFLLDMATFGKMLHQAVSGVVGEDHAGNVDVMTLVHISTDGPLRATELMSRIEITSGGMTKVIDRLELGGLVARTSDGADRRAVLVDLTQHGRAVLHRLDVALEDAVAGAITEHPDVIQRIRDALAPPPAIG